jgi:hypothetical protein
LEFAKIIFKGPRPWSVAEQSFTCNEYILEWMNQSIIRTFCQLNTKSNQIKSDEIKSSQTSQIIESNQIKPGLHGCTFRSVSRNPQ